MNLLIKLIIFILITGLGTIYKKYSDNNIKNKIKNDNKLINKYLKNDNKLINKYLKNDNKLINKYHNK
jgi:hypothetical protein